MTNLDAIMPKKPFIAYKATYNLQCKNVTYKIGETYQYHDNIYLCSCGYHCCRKPDDVLGYYSHNANLVLLEVEVLGKIEEGDDKLVTDKLRIIRIIPQSEYNKFFKRHKFDKNNKQIYNKYSDEDWEKTQYHKNGTIEWEQRTYGHWRKKHYDTEGRVIGIEFSDKTWATYQYADAKEIANVTIQGKFNWFVYALQWVHRKLSDEKTITGKGTI